MNFKKEFIYILLFMPLIMYSANKQGVAHNGLIRIIHPASGDVIFAGRTYLIQWKSDTDIKDFAIVLYRSGKPILNIADRCYGKNELEWQVPETLISAADYDIRISDVNNRSYYCSSGNIRIVGEKNYTVFPLRYRKSSRWKITTVDSGNVGYYSSIAVDGQNRPHISYYDGARGNLKYAYFNGTNWVIQDIDTLGNVGNWTSIAVNRENNYVHISYCHEGNRDLKYALWNGAGWQIETVDGVSDNRGEYTSITLDSNGDPHISYIKGTDGDCMYAKKDGATWNIVCADNEDDVGRYTVIALDNNDQPHISYHDYTDRLFNVRYWCKYAFYDGFSWLKQYIDSRKHTGYYTSIDVDSTNNPHVSYQGFSHCQYAHHTDNGWVIETIEPVSGELHMGGTSILLDDVDSPHICYYRASSDSYPCLKYARFKDSTWILEVIDDTSDVGGFCSMALDGEGYLHISYVDWTNQTLKYANGSIADIIVFPAELHFGNVKKNQTSEKTITIINRALFPRMIERIEIGNKDFSTIGQTFPQTIMPSESIIVTIQFAPSEQREYIDTLIVHSDDPLCPKIRVFADGNSFEEVRVYPNPFIPSRGHTYINFGRLPAGGKIYVYSIGGERLWFTNIQSNSDIYRWDTRIDSGKLLASGYYYYVIYDARDTVVKRGKLSVIR